MELKDLELAENLLEEAKKEMEGKWLSFWLDGQLYGVSIVGVEQIVSMQPVVEMPEYPAYAKGIINLRGAVIPVIDLRKRLGKPETVYTDHTCIIINSVEGERLGFIVDEVDSVIEISQEEFSSPPKLGEDGMNGYLSGIAHISGDDRKIILCLNAEKILRQEEFKMLQDIL